MQLNLVTQLSEWNPQLFREIKGSLKSRNITITVAISLLGQILLFCYFYSQLNFDKDYSQYCIRSNDYDCLKDAAGNILINWMEWWEAMFINLSGISIFVLLVVGTYLLINNLSQEESRGTLNFIRMSPRSEVNILMGKILGVPILLYLVVILAIPLYLWAGFSADIPLGKILSFWAILVASSILFYSAALLCSLVGAGSSSSFLALSGGAAVLVLLFLMIVMEYILFIPRRVKKPLKSYVGGVILPTTPVTTNLVDDESGTIDIICETNSPSAIKPPQPTYKNGVLACTEGTRDLSK